MTLLQLAITTEALVVGLSREELLEMICEIDDIIAEEDFTLELLRNRVDSMRSAMSAAAIFPMSRSLIYE
jgi:hypothetical protein